MQEIGLVADAVFMCKDRSITWEHLFTAYSFFEKERWRKDLLKYFFEPNRVTCLHNWRSATKEQSFLHLLTTIDARATTDPRDRVFALLSHPSATLVETYGQTTGTLIEADYNKSVQDIYKNVAERLITISKSLDILS
jgi:hypothetical protein